MRVKQGPEHHAIAGEPFRRQPICEVLDSMGNAINVHEYSVSLTITNSHGQGCLCDLSGGVRQGCARALDFPSVAQCPEGLSMSKARWNICIYFCLCLISLHTFLKAAGPAMPCVLT